MLHLSAHTQVLAQHTHEGDSDQVEQPHRGLGGQVSIVPPAGTQMDHMGSDCEVQTLLGPLYHLPQSKGAVMVVVGCVRWVYSIVVVLLCLRLPSDEFSGNINFHVVVEA